MDPSFETDNAPYLHWLDVDGRVLLSLGGSVPEGRLGVLDEREPDLTPVGTLETVPGTGLRLYVGADRLTAGSYTLRIMAWGWDGVLSRDLQQRVTEAARRTRSVMREGRTLPIAGYSRLGRTRKADPLAPREVEVVFEPASPYWLTEVREQALPAENTARVYVGGTAEAALRVTITAGASPVVNPAITTDVSVTIWRGTLPAGATLVIDGGPGAPPATLNGADARLGLSGPLPFLLPGEGTVSVAAPGASAVVRWQEGEL